MHARSLDPVNTYFSVLSLIEGLNLSFYLVTDFFLSSFKMILINHSKTCYEWVHHKHLSRVWLYPFPTPRVVKGYPSPVVFSNSALISDVVRRMLLDRHLYIWTTAAWCLHGAPVCPTGQIHVHSIGLAWCGALHPVLLLPTPVFITISPARYQMG